MTNNPTPPRQPRRTAPSASTSKKATPKKADPPATAPKTTRRRTTSTGTRHSDTALTRTRGRPTAAHPPRMSRILQNIALGNYLKTSAEAAGVNPATCKGWIQDGERSAARIHLHLPDLDLHLTEWADQHDLDTYRADSDLWTSPPPKWLPKGEEPYWHRLLFRHLVEHARARAEAHHVRAIRTASANDWRASAWWLERTRPELYGRTERVQHEGVQGGAPIQVQQVPSSDVIVARIQQIAAERRALEERAGSSDGGDRQ